MLTTKMEALLGEDATESDTSEILCFQNDPKRMKAAQESAFGKKVAWKQSKKERCLIQMPTGLVSNVAHFFCSVTFVSVPHEQCLTCSSQSEDEDESSSSSAVSDLSIDEDKPDLVKQSILQDWWEKKVLAKVRKKAVLASSKKKHKKSNPKSGTSSANKKERLKLPQMPWMRMMRQRMRTEKQKRKKHTNW